MNIPKISQREDCPDCPANVMYGWTSSTLDGHIGQSATLNWAHSLTSSLPPLQSSQAINRRPMSSNLLLLLHLRQRRRRLDPSSRTPSSFQLHSRSNLCQSHSIGQHHFDALSLSLKATSQNTTTWDFVLKSTLPHTVGGLSQMVD